MSAAASRRIIGIDPGLTRCGVGIIDVAPGRKLRFVHVSVIQTHADQELDQRLRIIGDGIEERLGEYEPDSMSLERVFAEQRNLNTVMGVAQISGIALREAAIRGISTQMHTPSEVKAAVTGYGRADKSQVGEMVRRLLGLKQAPKPADAADALALAICAAWHNTVPTVRSSERMHGSARAENVAAPTKAQEAWLAAERAARTGRGRLG
ncbi:crossover junction endodeoxyribonuclease RuvC [Gulosibacter molinativorax]|uniref:Crossover junction endodeoxyribonuclease RuvC n=1 Tax=Gulosibacter molinativorax TaxID=256821 RepID=A0ABT7C7K2_9MICO|nr:crossover junction endodeoxyribonuclease RuvC [Gulosibacter molinativorax]MDJ1371040.1 crossover junction endodeoxyribonuclease RuvC [Gulosibacter molinativorax]QUY61400.1 Crossover junction endodeoxyribonuclease RuvC [Gulosibacter molinativorax]